MADLNRVFLMGRLTFDPELRYTPSGSAVTDLRMATSRSWTGKEGDRKEETLYIDVTVWDRQAETCCQYLKKGSGIHVEGSLKMDTWDDKTTGEKRSKIKVQAERVQFLDRRSDAGGGGSEEGQAPPSARDSQPRRGGGPPSEGRGPSNGPARGGCPAQGNAPSRRPPAAPDPDEDDIPF
jgi:single-strand DNA-binding protein